MTSLIIKILIGVAIFFAGAVCDHLFYGRLVLNAQKDLADLKLQASQDIAALKTDLSALRAKLPKI